MRASSFATSSPMVGADPGQCQPEPGRHRDRAEAALSFLGVGIQDPTPTWGNMLSQSQSYMFQHPWLPLVPGIPLVLVSI